MQQSVPSPSVAQATFAATLFDEWVQLGLRDVVICPGSRSTPLVLACAARDDVSVHVRIDERSAGFFALGRALATTRPVVVVVTSGTAAAELLACVAEADLAFVPLIVVTADRPPELHGLGAPQTMDQHQLYGSKVRLFEEPGVASLEEAPSWRPLAARLWRGARGAGTNAGPVHLNAAFVEPLVEAALPLSGVSAQVVDDAAPSLARVEWSGLRVLCVVGRGVSRELVDVARSMEWVVLGDATSRGTLAHFDPLLRSDQFVARATPDLVVRLGGIPASKFLQTRLAQWSARTVAFTGAGFVADPGRLVGEIVEGLPDPSSAHGDPLYVDLWRRASNEVARWLEQLERDDDALYEPVVARGVVRASARSGVALVIGSSMPVRDVEWWAPTREAATFSNRGVNGIDGVVSTALGVGAGSSSIGLVGDVTMLHDVSGLVDGLGGARGTCVLVVTDNDGGGIFSFLPQSSALDVATFERFFATPRSFDLSVVATSFGHASCVVTTRSELEEAIDEGLARPGLTVVVAKVATRSENVELHDAWNRAVVDLVGKLA